MAIITLKVEGRTVKYNMEKGKNVLSKEQLKSLLKDYRGGMTYKEMSEKYHICVMTCYKNLKRLGVNFERKPTSGNRNHSFFSDLERRNELIKLYESNTPWKEIMEHFEISNTSCRRALNNAGIKLDRVGRKTRAVMEDSNKSKYLVELYKNGVKWETIEEEIGISQDECKKVLNTLGALTERKPRKSARTILGNKEREKALIEYYNSGMKWDEITKRMGISQKTCLRILKELGVQLNRKSKAH